MGGVKLMYDAVEFTDLLTNATTRRLWLLHSAIRSLPFDQAVSAAQTAEAFVIGHIVAETNGVPADAAASYVDPPDNAIRQTEEGCTAGLRQGPLTPQHSSIALPAEQRNRLLERLAAGAKNAELAAKFGLSQKQVQGLRMGCAREIAKRRTDMKKGAASPPDPKPIDTAAIDDIIRYLRQQDDVVVSQENGQYLVNGRFSMSVRELLARANRMRSRQQKPLFHLRGGMPVRPETICSGMDAPRFWENAPASREHDRVRPPE